MAIRLSRGEPTVRLVAADQGYVRAFRLRIAPHIVTIRVAICLLAVAFLISVDRPAAATQIAFDPSTGSSATPNAAAFPTGSPAASQYDPTVPAATFTASLTSSVYVGSTTNPYVNGTYDNNASAVTFVYQVGNFASSEDAITTFSVQSFAGLPASVSYDISAAGDYLPYTAERSGTWTADAIAFYFIPGIGTPGESAYLIINTDASNFSSVQSTLQDGSNTSAQSFAVYAPGNFMVPEPTSMVMMLLGLVGLLAVSRARWRRASA